MAKTRTREELIAFIHRADTRERLEIAEKFIGRLELRGELPEGSADEIYAELFTQSDALWDEENPDYYEREELGDYGPSCPWNAPGMRVSDFI